MRKKISIIFGHYSETKERDAISIRCVEALQQFRTPDTELIIVANGYYNNKIKFLCDVYCERPADPLPGRTLNLGIDMARGDVFVLMSNDVLLEKGAVGQMVSLLERFPQNLATCVYNSRLPWHNLTPLEGYPVNERVGSDCVAMTRSQYEDIGRFDEVYLHSDFVNYVNRWIAKGYAVTMTKRRMGKHVAFGTNSYHQQRSQFFNVKGYQGKQMLSRDDLIRATFREHLPALKTLYDYWN